MIGPRITSLTISEPPPILPDIHRPRRGQDGEPSMSRQLQTKSNYAPFLSTSPKQAANKKKQSKLTIETPGPGQYNVAIPLVKPLIETIKKSNNNIIIKIHETGSPAFRDGSERFKVRKPDAPGPGQYKTIQIQKDIIVHHQIQNSLQLYKDKFKEVFEQQRTPSIQPVKVLSTSRDIADKIQSHREYHFQRRLINQQKGPNWAKYSQQRFKMRAPSVPGPGAYDHNNQSAQKKLPSSSFASESVRSFFDNIYFETNQQAKALLREKINYKSEVPGPGAYINNEASPPKPVLNKFQFFGSTEERSMETPTAAPLIKPVRQKSIDLQNLRDSLEKYGEERRQKNFFSMHSPRNLDEAVQQISSELKGGSGKVGGKIFQQPSVGYSVSVNQSNS